MKFFEYLFHIIRLAWRDINRKSVRFEIVSGVTGIIPGKFGREIRKNIWSRYLGGSGPNIIIHKNVKILHPDKLIIGDYVHLGIGNYIQAGGGVYIGEYTLLGPFVKIWSVNHRFDDPQMPIQDQGYAYKPVYIGSHVWVGADSFIMPGTRIGDGCVISAGSVVGAKSYPNNTILAGNPARKIGERIRA